MKIYDGEADGDINGNNGTTKNRKKGSLVRNTTGSTVGGRKPFHPHNQNSDTPMHALRKSLHRDAYSKNSSPTITSQLQDKENQPTSGSAQELRRSLRATVSSHPLPMTRTSRGEEIGRRKLRTSLGPPQRVPVASPGSLLRTELNDEDLEESLLVSPPGALWNVLNTSSTGLVVVSPQAAEHLNQTWSEQRHNIREEESKIFSPPKPRTLLPARTPLPNSRTENSSSDQVKSSSIQNIKGPVKEDNCIQKSIMKQAKPGESIGDKGVCIDMTSLFSNYKNDPSSKKSPPPSRFLRLSAKKPVKGEIKPSTDKSTKPAFKPRQLSSSGHAQSTKKKTKLQVKNTNTILSSSSKLYNNIPEISSFAETPKSDNVVPETSSESTRKRAQIGVSIDMSAFFGKSTSPCARGTPPPHLAARLNRSSNLDTSQHVERSKVSTVKGRAVSLPETETFQSKVGMNETYRSRNGVAMDVSEASTRKSSALKSDATVHPHLRTQSSRIAKPSISTNIEVTTVPSDQHVSETKKPVTSFLGHTQPKNGARKSVLMTKSRQENAGAAVSSGPPNDHSKSISQQHRIPRLIKRNKQYVQKARNDDSQLTTKEKASQLLGRSHHLEIVNKRHLSTGKPTRGFPTGHAKKTRDPNQVLPERENANFCSKTSIAKGSSMTTTVPMSASTHLPSAFRQEKNDFGIITPHSGVNGNSPTKKKPSTFPITLDTTVLRNQTHPHAHTTPKASNLALPCISIRKINIAEHGDDWADKQCTSFVAWLDFVLNPAEEDEDDVNHFTQSSDAETRINMRALLIHRRLAKVRLQASELFHGEAMRKIKSIIHAEIFKGRLSIRTDRELHADLSLRRQLISLLLSYTTPWLRLGLEVFFGESIEPEQPTSEKLPEHMTHITRMKYALRKFIADRVLSDADVLAKYTKGRCKVPSGKFEKQYNAEMRVLVLYRILVIVFFLDQAKAANVLERVPRLFGKGAAIKSSKAVLLTICRDFLSAEGDIMKHLSRIGLSVSFKQEAIDELDYKVSNIATDLRDGVRLTKMTEILTGVSTKSLMSILRVPAVSRLQKLHNVNVALRKLKEFGILIPDDVIAHHIVDGHREMNLKLIWAVIAHCCLSKLLDSNTVEVEIGNVIRSNQARRKVHGQGSVSGGLAPKLKTEPPPTNAPSEEIMKSLLLRWCHAVCSSFGLEVSDFSESFADGRAICLLIHYYHPSIIKRHEILPTSKSHSQVLSFEQAVQNERANSIIASRRVAELGGIPKMIPLSDVENPPDEKSMLLCLSFMCSRLMESSKEIFAAILIQASYRRYRHNVMLAKKVAAARVILWGWRHFKINYFKARQLRYGRAVVVLERFALSRKRQILRLKANRLRLQRELFAAIVIQTYIRAWKERRKYIQTLTLHHAAVKIQSALKVFVAKTHLCYLVLRRNSCTSIQKNWRQFREKKRYTQAILAAKFIQKVARGFLGRREWSKRHNAALVIQKAWRGLVSYWQAEYAATTIQTVWRGSLARWQASILSSRRDAACTIQRVWRGHFRTTLFFVFLESAILLQKVVRGYLSRKICNYQRCTLAAVAIQSVWRSFSAQVRRQMDLLDIISVQTQFRAKKARSLRDNRIRSILTIQNAIRRMLAKRAYRELIEEKKRKILRENSILVCQCAVRCWLAKLKFYHKFQYHYSAMSIQTQWRKHVLREAFRLALVSAVKIQSNFRGCVVRGIQRKHSLAARRIQEAWRFCVVVSTRNNAAARIQRHWRGYYCKIHFNAFVSHVTNIQAVFRGYFVRKEMDKYHFAARILQSNWRCYWAKLNFNLDVLEVIIVQSAVRRYLAVKQSQHRREAIDTIQRAVRAYQAFIFLESLRYEQLELAILTGAAVVVQSCVRKWAAQDFRRRVLSSVLSLQSLWRGKQARAYFRAIDFAIIRLQAAYRGKKQRQLHLLSCGMSTRIQSRWRCFAIREKYRILLADIIRAQSIVRRHLSLKFAAKKTESILLIQKWTRKLMAYRYLSSIRDAKRREMYASITIQSMHRARVAQELFRMKLRSATLLQKVIRQYISRTSYITMKSHVTIIQSYVRKRRAVIHCSKMKASIVIIQSTFRLCNACAKVLRLRKEKLALLLQKMTRGFMVRRTICSLHIKATLIQSVFRSHYRRLCYEMDTMDIILAQSVARRWLVLKSLQTKSWAATTIQNMVRRRCAITFSSLLDFEKHCKKTESNSAIQIQKCWRGRVSRVFSRQHAAARKIQKTWRCFIAHVDFLIQVMSVIKIQAKMRQVLTTKALGAANRAVVKLQAQARGRIQRRHRLIAMASATKIQATFREYAVRQKQATTKQAAILVQKLIRGHLCRVDLHLANFAASDIQRIWRGYSSYIDFALKVIEMVKIQKHVRRFLSRRSFERLKLLAWAERQYHNKMCSVIQNRFRSYLHAEKLEKSATVIQAVSKAFLQRRRVQKLRCAVIRFQAYTRGNTVRRKRTKKIVALARRISFANEKAKKDPKLRLGYRTKHALTILQKSNSLTEIMSAVKTLEAATRLSYACCEVFTRVNAARILLNLIESCNRSVPHVELVLSTLLTLNNIAKHPRLLPSFADCISAEIFLDKMQMFRDSDSIFCLSVSLLGCIAECNPAVKELCSVHEHLKRLNSVYQMSIRRAKKQKLGEQRTMNGNGENFDMLKAVKALGRMIKSFEQLAAKPSSGDKHFKF